MRKFLFIDETKIELSLSIHHLPPFLSPSNKNTSLVLNVFRPTKFFVSNARMTLLLPGETKITVAGRPEYDTRAFRWDEGGREERGRRVSSVGRRVSSVGRRVLSVGRRVLSNDLVLRRLESPLVELESWDGAGVRSLSLRFEEFGRLADFFCCCCSERGTAVAEEDGGGESTKDNFLDVEDHDGP